MWKGFQNESEHCRFWLSNSLSENQLSDLAWYLRCSFVTEITKSLRLPLVRCEIMNLISSTFRYSQLNGAQLILKSSLRLSASAK